MLCIIIHNEASFSKQMGNYIKKYFSWHDAISALHIIPSCISRINKYFHKGLN